MRTAVRGGCNEAGEGRERKREGQGAESERLETREGNERGEREREGETMHGGREGQRKSEGVGRVWTRVCSRRLLLASCVILYDDDDE